MKTSDLPGKPEDRHRASSITKYLIELGHRIQPSFVFSALYINIKDRLLRFVSLAIENVDRKFCIQKIIYCQPIITSVAQESNYQF